MRQETREKEHLKSQENNLFQVWTPCQKSDDQSSLRPNKTNGFSNTEVLDDHDDEVLVEHYSKPDWSGFKREWTPLKDSG